MQKCLSSQKKDAQSIAETAIARKDQDTKVMILSSKFSLNYFFYFFIYCIVAYFSKSNEKLFKVNKIYYKNASKKCFDDFS